MLSHLFKTGKYEIVEYATGLKWSQPETQSVPWKCYGVLPDDQGEFESLMRGDQGIARAVTYGAFNIDRVVKEVKPDVIISVEDFWGINFLIDKPYFKKIPTVLWTTLDSLPLLNEAVKRAQDIPNYFVWSEFAEKEMHRLGHTHVKTLHGAIDTEHFHRMPNVQRIDNRHKFEINDRFIIGFVFRNQLRKLVPNLLEGYADWKKGYGLDKKTSLLLHTHWSEPAGWDIPRLIEQYKVKPEEVLTTYICRQCAQYEVKPFDGQEKDCRFCRTAKAQVTTSTGFGVTEKQLNEIYNLMDVYIHPFTSGGQEMPIQEAKLTELVTLVTDYACGEDMCVPEAGSVPLEWAKYTELGTQFIKASTYPSSITKQLTKVHSMKEVDRLKLGKKGRQWVLENFATEVIGKKIEDIVESFPPREFDFDAPTYVPKNAMFPMPDIQNELEWVQALYKGILLMDEPEDSKGVKDWLTNLKNGQPRQKIYEYFIKVAHEENQKNLKVEFSKLLGSELPENRVLFCIPQSLGDVFICTSLFKSMRETYPDKVIYVATKREYFDVIACNPYVDNLIEWQPFMDNLLLMEGFGNEKGHFDIVFLPHLVTQRMLNYLHNGNDKVRFNVHAPLLEVINPNPNFV